MPYSVNIWYGYFVNGLADGHKIINAQNGLKWRFLRKWRNLREFSLFFTIFHVKLLLYTKYFGSFSSFFT